jgi:hypothetical protein
MAHDVPDLVGQAQAEVQQAEAAGRALAAERRALNDRLEAAARTGAALRREVKRAEDALQDASTRAADAAALAELGHVEDGAAAEVYSAHLDEIAQRLGRLAAAAEEDKRRRAVLDTEDRALGERERAAEERTREARAALEHARAQQPLLDLCGLARDCAASQGRLTLLNARVAREGTVVAWVTDGLPNYLYSSGRTWMVSDFGEARRVWPQLPEGWREQRRRFEACGVQTVPADGLVSAAEVVEILERFLRPTSYRLTSVHHTHRDANGVDRYVVHTADGTRPVALETAGIAWQVLGR